MTVFTGIAVAIVVTGGAAAAPAAAIGASMGAGGAAAAGTAGVAGAVAGGFSAGAVAGASAGLTASAALTGAAAGGTAAAGVGCSTIGGYGLVTAGFTAGPVGWLVVGTSPQVDKQRATYDCWKPVLHDSSEEPSKGMLLKDLCAHPNIAHVDCTVDNGSDLPDIIIENIWHERFAIEYLLLPVSGQLFGHIRKL